MESVQREHLDHYQYVLNRFETVPPTYEDALQQNGLDPRYPYVRIIKIEGRFLTKFYLEL